MSDGQGFRALGQGIASAGSQLQQQSNRQLQRLQQQQRTQATIRLQRGLSEVEEKFEGLLSGQFNALLGTKTTAGDAEWGNLEGLDILDEDTRKDWFEQQVTEVIEQARQSISTPGGRADFDNRSSLIRQQYEELLEEKVSEAMIEWDRSVTPVILNDLIKEFGASGDIATGISSAQEQLEGAVMNGTYSAPQANQMLSDFKDGLIRRTVLDFVNDPVDEEGTPFEVTDLEQAYEATKAYIDELYTSSYGMSAQSRAELLGIAEDAREGRREVVANALRTNTMAMAHRMTRAWARTGQSRGEIYETMKKAMTEMPQWEILSTDQQTDARLALNTEIGRLYDATASGSVEETVANLNDKLKLDYEHRWVPQYGIDEANRMVRDALQNEIYPFIEQNFSNQNAALQQRNDVERSWEGGGERRGFFQEIHGIYAAPYRDQENDNTIQFDNTLRNYGIDPNSRLGSTFRKTLMAEAGMTESDQNRNQITEEHLTNALQRLNTAHLASLTEGRWWSRDIASRVAGEGFDLDNTARIFARLGEGDSPPAILTDAARALISSHGTFFSQDGSINMEEIRSQARTQMGLDVDTELDGRQQQYIESLVVTSVGMIEMGNIIGRSMTLGSNQRPESFRQTKLENYRITNVSWDERLNQPIYTMEYFIDNQDPNTGDPTRLTRHYRVESAEDAQGNVVLNLQPLDGVGLNRFRILGSPFSSEDLKEFLAPPTNRRIDWGGVQTHDGTTRRRSFGE